MMEILHTEKAPEAIGPYSQAIEANGLIFLSGQLGLIPDTGAMAHSLAAQTVQALENIISILKSANLTLKDVVKTTCYLSNMEDFSLFNEIYAQYFGDHKPARSCFAVARLPKDALVEIEVIATSFLCSCEKEALAMKLLHLSDLHLGKRVNGFSMLEDQRVILTQIVDLAEEEKVDAVLLAGDLYDKPVPPAEAVTLLDRFLTRLSGGGIPVFAISGNHDSPERLAFATRLLAGEGIHLTAQYQGPQPPFLLQDEYGDVAIYALPYLKPALVRHWNPEADIASYEEAVSYALGQWAVDKTRRNVLLAHQFVTGGVTCESEERSVGGRGSNSGPSVCRV